MNRLRRAKRFINLEIIIDLIISRVMASNLAPTTIGSTDE